MIEGTVASLAKSMGDPVAQGEVIAEIETEKVNYDLEAVDSGFFPSCRRGWSDRSRGWAYRLRAGGGRGAPGGG